MSTCAACGEGNLIRCKRISGSIGTICDSCGAVLFFEPHVKHNLQMHFNIKELAAKYNLSPLHPAIVELNTLAERAEALAAELGRPFVVENGPWTASEDGKTVESDDFTHDVVLVVKGDFESDEQRKVYANEIARRLNVRA